ncbi:acetyltransferase (GNAT) family protein [Homoserinimonas aerilata]|uniref:Acetyltransferase (GNAT) family protein n=1 Tax=Homoserinimonas aerilata TaxID=1162970 RepID=A0A542YFC8_9MICO|nr:GNAT family N-acetyltransferase [Homoserinimonas aerilata]TQL46791.1 acetyltransferase (GNAT) family protein [Homoserinimonas aerilata]
MTASEIEHEIKSVAYDHADSTMLRAAQRAEIAAAYGGEETEPGEPLSAADAALFLVAYDDGIPAGCGGLRILEGGDAEVKRMYVTPSRRGTGVAPDVLHALEAAALELGIARLVLETGDRLKAAIRFYEREGYSRIPNFGAYVDAPFSFCYAKTLLPAS